MNRIIIIVKLIIAIIPAFIIGYLLRLSFKHIPDWLFYAIVLIIAVVGGLYLIFITRKKYIEDGAEEYMPKWLDKSSYLYVIIGSIIGVLLASTTFRTILYVDNGRSVPVSVNILYDQTFIIPAKSYIQTSVSTGENELLIDGKTKKIILPESGNWIFNIDSLNTYVITTVNYSNSVELYKDGKIDSTQLNDPKYKIIKGELFKAKVDFLFDAPESIKIKKYNKDKTITKTILYKLNN